MSTSSLDRTRYRVSQLWDCEMGIPGVDKSLQILSVEEHPTHGIFCCVSVKFDPPIKQKNGTCESTELYLTAAALDRSVKKLAKERASLPEHFRSTGEFRVPPDQWLNAKWLYITDTTVQNEIERLLASIVPGARKKSTNRSSLRSQKTVRANSAPRSRLPSMTRAIERGDLEGVTNLLEADPAAINRPCSDSNPDPPLNYAVWQGRAKIARHLIDQGANVKARGDLGRTPLHYAAQEQNAKLARLLIEHGADVDTLDDLGASPLFSTVPVDNEVVAILLEAGATIDLNTAIRLRRIEWVKTKLAADSNAVLNARFPELLISDVIVWWVQTPQMFADERDSRKVREENAQNNADALAVVKRLLELGADANSGTALFYSVQLTDSSVARLLLDHGANPNRDVDKGIATYFLDTVQNEEMRVLLRQHGAKENPYPRAKTNY